MERPKTTLHVSLLAKEFHARIRKTLTPSELQHVDKVNDAQQSSSTCATHDYIDANEEMMIAFINVMDRNTIDLVDKDVLLWNMAWELAQYNGFTKDWDDRPRAG